MNRGVIASRVERRGEEADGRLNFPGSPRRPSASLRRRAFAVTLHISAAARLRAPPRVTVGRRTWGLLADESRKPLYSCFCVSEIEDSLRSVLALSHLGSCVRARSWPARVAAAHPLDHPPSLHLHSDKCVGARLSVKRRLLVVDDGLPFETRGPPHGRRRRGSNRGPGLLAACLPSTLRRAPFPAPAFSAPFGRRHRIEGRAPAPLIRVNRRQIPPRPGPVRDSQLCEHPLLRSQITECTGSGRRWRRGLRPGARRNRLRSAPSRPSDRPP